MEFTEMKKSLFGGYRKDDVVRYISELNEEHSLEISSKTEEYAILKGTTDAKVTELNTINKESAEKIEKLEADIENLRKELDEFTEKYTALKAEYDAMDRETEDLRRKSDIIATAIINAEKCAGQLISEANANADTIISKAESKVKAEADRLVVAKDYVKQIRQTIMEVFHKIDDTLKNTESDILRKKDNIETPDIAGDVESAEKFGVIPKSPWSKRA